ncbi:hypothetical protein DPEC_G00276180 [Dallia pectoralis]|uniref:Uncharacterized protein n=1 Tax=Dallia pectoralis TaxID=75939 RepID=A0ACC2FLH4_DALPE|nr:hypothetical protein DPEC_G00276180 [Dallia pectoralis]
MLSREHEFKGARGRALDSKTHSRERQTVLKILSSTGVENRDATLISLGYISCRTLTVPPTRRSTTALHRPGGTFMTKPRPIKSLRALKELLWLVRSAAAAMPRRPRGLDVSRSPVTTVDAAPTTLTPPDKREASVTAINLPPG